MFVNIKIEKKDKWLVVYLEGRIDVIFSQKLENLILKKIAEGNVYFLFDFEKINYLSSSGLRVFITFIRKAKKLRGDIRFCQLQESVKKIIKIVNLEKLFNLYSSEEEALIDD